MVRGIYRDSILWGKCFICNETCAIVLWAIIMCGNVCDRLRASPGMILSVCLLSRGRVAPPHVVVEALVARNPTQAPGSLQCPPVGPRGVDHHMSLISKIPSL